MTTPDPPATARGPLTVVVPMPPSYRGGTEEYAYQLVRAYSDRRTVHVVTTTARTGADKEGLSIGSATLEPLPARDLLDRPVVQGAAAWRRLRQAVESASVVQLHMPFPRVEGRVTRWAKKAGVPVVLTYHMDAEFGKNPEGLFPRMVTWGYRRFSSIPALANATVVISNSLGYAKASPVLSRFLPKVRVIYQGVDLARLQSGAPTGAESVPARTTGGRADPLHRADRAVQGPSRTSSRRPPAWSVPDGASSCWSADEVRSSTNFARSPRRSESPTPCGSSGSSRTRPWGHSTPRPMSWRARR